MAEWEWVMARESSSKSMSHPSVLPDEPDEYGGRYTNDDEEPFTEYSFRAEVGAVWYSRGFYPL